MAARSDLRVAELDIHVATGRDELEALLAHVRGQCKAHQAWRPGSPQHTASALAVTALADALNAIDAFNKPLVAREAERLAAERAEEAEAA